MKRQKLYQGIYNGALHGAPTIYGKTLLPDLYVPCNECMNKADNHWLYLP